MKLGLMTLGDLLEDPVTGTAMTPEERYRMLIDAAVLCDEAGFHSINLGEHHGLGYEISSPPVLLAAIAERTTDLRLSTAVTLLANLDTFRLAEDYATVDVISGGRVEIVAVSAELPPPIQIGGTPVCSGFGITGSPLIDGRNRPSQSTP